jgi:hypothetical protein
MDRRAQQSCFLSAISSGSVKEKVKQDFPVFHAAARRRSEKARLCLARVDNHFDGQVWAKS